MTGDTVAGPIGACGPPTVTLRLFAAARVAADTSRAEISGSTVEAVLSAASQRWGPSFAQVLASSRVWLNGEPADLAQPLRAGDEVAVLPPVSGGAR
jgi:molybdopterin synthase sulfur carrier subunit